MSPVSALASASPGSEVCEPFVFPLARSLAEVPELVGRELLLDRGEYVFREGDLKSSCYRLDSGILCITAKTSSGPPRVVEMLFPGAFIGLGFLERHIDSAMAVLPSRLTAFPLSAAADLCNSSAAVRDRQADLTEREFAARRRELVPASDDLRRVAAFLTAISAINRREGRDPAFVAEFVKTGDAAAFLGLEVEALARALTDLKQRGLIDRAQQGGLVLHDLQSLEALSSEE